LGDVIPLRYTIFHARRFSPGPEDDVRADSPLTFHGAGVV
jgi:hypothetical protein